MKRSLGLLEVAGLALAVTTADVMTKCAAITLVAVEPAKGGGWMTIKVTGDVASVQAALQTGAELARRAGGLVAMTTLARPDDQLMAWIVPSKPSVPAPAADSRAAPAPAVAAMPSPAQVAPPSAEPVVPARGDAAAEPTGEAVDTTQGDSPEEADAGPAADTEATPVASCNLCLDPRCPRQKGEPRRNCLHAARS
ncbi:BMC domain-containing protein [Pseudaeromonas sp. ZJS20]|uniref:BMC domain-containing protein n=1 Tax=Pseudaeromonas aegiceratis TaxID=3153928 RepID=UPI00390CC598